MRFATVEAGVRYTGRPDVMLARLAPGTADGGVFTRSATRSAAVLDCQAKIGPRRRWRGDHRQFGQRQRLHRRAARGDGGVTGAVADARLPEARVFSASTGVIGEPLPHERITAWANSLAAAAPDGLEGAGAGDHDHRHLSQGGGHHGHRSTAKPVHIAGIAKGSGMIAPDMATMLVYIFTDAAIDQPDRSRHGLTDAQPPTFNCITVDSDTSTSDTLLVAATGASGIASTEKHGLHGRAQGVMRDLAHQVVRDGEGRDQVRRSPSPARPATPMRRTHALAIANSPLVKTAIAGEDPNWGRIVMAVGKSGARADRDRLAIRLGDIAVAENGWVADTYPKLTAPRYMKPRDIRDRGRSRARRRPATVWTCDLTHGYIDINADYRS